jgi:hypothetical protein
MIEAYPGSTHKVMEWTQACIKPRDFWENLLAIGNERLPLYERLCWLDKMRRDHGDWWDRGVCPRLLDTPLRYADELIPEIEDD